MDCRRPRRSGKEAVDAKRRPTKLGCDAALGRGPESGERTDMPGCGNAGDHARQGNQYCGRGNARASVRADGGVL